MKTPEQTKYLYLSVLYDQGTNVSVNDLCNGLGISPEDVEFVFVRWHHVHVHTYDGRELEWELSHSMHGDLKRPDAVKLCDLNGVLIDDVEHVISPFTEGAWSQPDTPTLQMRIIMLEERVMELDSDLSTSVTWRVEDFETVAFDAEQIYSENNSLTENQWRVLYDRSKFHEALAQMIQDHSDRTRGITWQTVNLYLEDMCRITGDER